MRFSHQQNSATYLIYTGHFDVIQNWHEHVCSNDSHQDVPHKHPAHHRAIQVHLQGYADNEYTR